MSTNSPLEKIREMMEAKLEESFIPKLIDRAVEYHTRQGLRPGCDCSYCLEKVRATWEIGHVNIRAIYDQYYLPRGHALHYDFDWRENHIKDAIWRYRKHQRLLFRLHLKERKQEII